MALLTLVPGVVPEFTQADRLRKARELTGLDQTQFAERAGISRQTVSNYEGGLREPRGLYLRAWAEATGVDMHWLQTGEPSSDNDGGPSVTHRYPKRPVILRALEVAA